MDERCKTCSRLCKRLDPEDAPARYSFLYLAPRQTMALIESRIKGLALWHHLSVEQSEHSTGDQLAVLLKVQYMPDRSDNHIVIIAQAAKMGEGQTDLWFRYGVPVDCCDQGATPDFHALIIEVIESISQVEFLLSKQHTPKAVTPSLEDATH